jgi:hypothetical protein
MLWLYQVTVCERVCTVLSTLESLCLLLIVLFATTLLWSWLAGMICSAISEDLDAVGDARSHVFLPHRILGHE